MTPRTGARHHTRVSSHSAVPLRMSKGDLTASDCVTAALSVGRWRHPVRILNARLKWLASAKPNLDAIEATGMSVRHNPPAPARSGGGEPSRRDLHQTQRRPGAPFAPRPRVPRRLKPWGDLVEQIALDPLLNRRAKRSHGTAGRRRRHPTSAPDKSSRVAFRAEARAVPDRSAMTPVSASMKCGYEQSGGRPTLARNDAPRPPTTHRGL